MNLFFRRACWHHHGVPPTLKSYPPQVGFPFCLNFSQLHHPKNWPRSNQSWISTHCCRHMKCCFIYERNNKISTWDYPVVKNCTLVTGVLWGGHCYSTNVVKFDTRQWSLPSDIQVNSVSCSCLFLLLSHCDQLKLYLSWKIMQDNAKLMSGVNVRPWV